jgi:DNA sulfur modification protein DndB
MVAAQLFQLTPDPRKEAPDALRHQFQREFDGAKKKNVGSYAAYIVDVAHGKPGQIPPITLYTPDELPVEEHDDGSAILQIPWDVQLTALDGETQLAARYDAQIQDPETRHQMVAVDICWHESPQWARQVFHDLNALGVKPTVALSLSMDERDAVTAVCREVEARVPFFTGRVNSQRRQLSRRDKEVVTITGLRGACATLAKGITGVAFGTKTVPLTDEQTVEVTRAAVDWFAAVAGAIGEELNDRTGTIAASNGALAAIGAVGHKTLHVKDARERKDLATALARDVLRGVNWTRGPVWDGIAGRMTTRGKFSIAGTKEAAYGIFAALTEEGSDAYVKVRA